MTRNVPLGFKGVEWSFLIPTLDFFFNFQKSPLQLLILMQRRLINVHFKFLFIYFKRIFLVLYF